MPSSMIFVGLVVIWLLILLPAVARHRQEVARPSEAALAGRVLDRPRRGEPEAYDMVDTDPARPVVDRRAPAASVPLARVAVDDDLDDAPVAADEHDREREQPEPRYRPGRGGYDAASAAAAARARAVFRQRVVLVLLVAALASGVVAAAAVTTAWWVFGAAVAGLVGYLGYLRSQVRMEEAIRERRAARMAGSRRRPAARETDAPRARDTAPDHDPRPAPAGEDADDLLREEPERVTGTGAQLPRILTSLDELTVESALPRLPPAPPPPLPAGTALVEETEDDPADHALDTTAGRDHRRAVGE